jgi:hypothetical protein
MSCVMPYCRNASIARNWLLAQPAGLQGKRGAGVMRLAMACCGTALNNILNWASQHWALPFAAMGHQAVAHTLLAQVFSSVRDQLTRSLLR